MYDGNITTTYISLPESLVSFGLAFFYGTVEVTSEASCTEPTPLPEGYLIPRRDPGRSFLPSLLPPSPKPHPLLYCP